MRIWSLHPKYLDAKGLVACWRETLLAKNVLEGKTKGYQHHSQLIRFRASEDALSAIHQYLFFIHQEAECRGYHFDSSKFKIYSEKIVIPVTKGQMNYEWNHLLKKISVRSPQLYPEFLSKAEIHPHPLFTVVDGEIESWEII